MTKNTARTDEEFDQIKRQINTKVTRVNARDLFEAARNKFMRQLQTLNVNDITQVEDLNTTGMELIRTVYYVLVEKKAQKSGRPFNEVGLDTGAGDITLFLIESFKTNLLQHHFTKINAIEEKYKPGVQEWAQIHKDLLTLALGLTQEDPTISKITETIENKVSFLKTKAREFDYKKDTNAAKLVRAFTQNIIALTQDYLENRNVTTFSRSMLEQIGLVRDVLEKQPWWQLFIDEVANMLTQLVRNESPHVRFSLFSVPGKETLNDLQASIDKLKKPEDNPVTDSTNKTL